MTPDEEAIRLLEEIQRAPREVGPVFVVVQSKAATGREKDRLFLATHADALKQLLGGSE